MQDKNVLEESESRDYQSAYHSLGMMMQIFLIHVTTSDATADFIFKKHNDQEVLKDGYSAVPVNDFHSTRCMTPHANLVHTPGVSSSSPCILSCLNIEQVSSRQS